MKPRLIISWILAVLLAVMFISSGFTKLRDLNGTMGMTLRDWFAGQALTGWMHDGLPRDRDDVVARECYAMADAMLAERATSVDAPSSSAGLLEALEEAHRALMHYEWYANPKSGWASTENLTVRGMVDAAIAKAKGGAA